MSETFFISLYIKGNFFFNKELIFFHLNIRVYWKEYKLSKVMKIRWTQNEKRLWEYFEDKAKLNQAPKIITVASETNISPATISRYARRRGYMSYSDMLSCLLRENAKGQINDKGFIDFLKQAKADDAEIVIICSYFTEVIGMHLKIRLSNLNFRVRIAQQDLNVDLPLLSKNAVVIGITLTMESARALKAIEFLKKSNHKTFVVTTVDVDETEAEGYNVQFATFPEMSKSKDFKNSEWESLRRLFDFLDDCMNTIHSRANEWKEK